MLNAGAADFKMNESIDALQSNWNLRQVWVVNDQKLKTWEIFKLSMFFQFF
jgi:hypothetical protein